MPDTFRSLLWSLHGRIVKKSSNIMKILNYGLRSLMISVEFMTKLLLNCETNLICIFDTWRNYRSNYSSKCGQAIKAVGNQPSSRTKWEVNNMCNMIPAQRGHDWDISHPKVSYQKIKIVRKTRTKFCISIRLGLLLCFTHNLCSIWIMVKCWTEQ